MCLARNVSCRYGWGGWHDGLDIVEQFANPDPSVKFLFLIKYLYADPNARLLAFQILVNTDQPHRGLEGRVRGGKSAGGISYGYRVRRELMSDGTISTGDRTINETKAATFHARQFGSRERIGPRQAAPPISPRRSRKRAARLA